MKIKDQILLEQAYEMVNKPSKPSNLSNQTWYIVQIDEYGGDVYIIRGKTFEDAVAQEIQKDKFALGFDVEGEFHNDPEAAVKAVIDRQPEIGGTSDNSWFQIYGPGFGNINEMPRSKKRRLEQFELNQ